MISIKPNPPQHPLLPPRPPMLQDPRRNRQETLPKYKSHPLKGGGMGMQIRAGVGQAPMGQKGGWEDAFAWNCWVFFQASAPVKQGPGVVLRGSKEAL